MAHDPLFVTYWFGHAGNGLALAQIPEYFDVVNLYAFDMRPEVGLDNGLITSGGISWGEILSGARALQARGTKVLVSIRGLVRTPQSGDAPADPEHIASLVEQRVAEWELDGIDINPEIDEGGRNLPSNEIFIETVRALGRRFGPASGTGRSMTYASHEFEADRRLLEATQELFDYVSLMGYYWPVTEMIAQFEQYAALVDSERVLIGVSPANPATPPAEVRALARWQPVDGAKGGMMEYNINQDTGFTYAEIVHEAMTSRA